MGRVWRWPFGPGNTTTMKINKHAQVELCASNEATRHVITFAYLDTQDEGAPKLVSTNGRMMAVVPVEMEEGDDSGFITVESLKAARKAAGSRSKESQLKANGNLTLPNGQSFPRPSKDDMQYPNWRQVVPAADRESKFRIRLDAELLFKLAKAISGNGDAHVTLEFGSDERDVIKVTGTLPGGYGVLMPCRMS
jgi:hypothetical protein